MPRIALCAVLLAAFALAGCSLKDSNSSSGGSAGGAPPSGAKSSDKKAVQQLGFPITATRNTTRVSGSDPVADAAGVATALYPAADPTTSPPAVVLVDKDDWQAAIAAGVLTAAPLKAPILLSDGSSIPPVTQQTLDQLKPKGTSLTKGAQVALVGSAPPPNKLKSAALKGKDAYQRAAAIDRFNSTLRGKPSPNVILASGEQSGYATPAAAWAARSGDAVLFTKQNSLPAPTRKALQDHEKPNIYVLGPPSVISQSVMKQLSGLGNVKRVGSQGVVQNAIAFARYKDGNFGWGAVVPGQNLTVANSSRPGDAAAAAGLGANGVFAPLLLTDQAKTLPRQLEGYLLDIQPGFEGGDPSQGVYNHVWILGPADTVSPEAQARIDQATALVPVDSTQR